MKLLNKKTWLSPDDASFIFTQVVKGGFGLDATLKISGGGEVANFWISIDSKKDRKAVVKMLDKLTNDLNNMAIVLEEMEE